jgi:glutaredoxin
MKNVKMFYLKTCPYCERAFRYINDLKREKEAYKNIKIDYIDEYENKEISDKYDYDLVPCFFIDDKKIHEGVTNKEEIDYILNQAL